MACQKGTNKHLDRGVKENQKQMYNSLFWQQYPASYYKNMYNSLSW